MRVEFPALSDCISEETCSLDPLSTISGRYKNNDVKDFFCAQVFS